MKTKAMALFATLMIVLSVAGVAYAHWSEIIKINAVVEMGSLTVGFTEIVAEWDKEDWLDYYGYDTKEVAETECNLKEPVEDVHTGKTGFLKLWCNVTNAYPEYWGINKFNISCLGNVPAVISGITITYDDTKLDVAVGIPGIMWEFIDLETGDVAFNVWLYKEPEDYGPGWEIDPPWMFPGAIGDIHGVRSLVGNQIDPCHKQLTEICVHIKQEAQECHTYEFDIEIEFVNWDP